MRGGNRLRVIMVTIVAAIILLFAGLSWYKYQYSMGIIAQKEFNEQESTHLLIASQDSEFKSGLADSLIQALIDKPIHIKLIDVTQLDEVDATAWDAFVIIHTWEYFKPEKNTRSFVKSLVDKDKLVLVTTSADGKLGMKNIDGISCASYLDQQQAINAKIMERLEGMIAGLN